MSIFLLSVCLFIPLSKHAVQSFSGAESMTDGEMKVWRSLFSHRPWVIGENVILLPWGIIFWNGQKRLKCPRETDRVIYIKYMKESESRGIAYYTSMGQRRVCPPLFSLSLHPSVNKIWHSHLHQIIISLSFFLSLSLSHLRRPDLITKDKLSCPVFGPCVWPTCNQPSAALSSPQPTCISHDVHL